MITVVIYSNPRYNEARYIEGTLYYIANVCILSVL
jgi:hypothetical protein